ncbi:TPA: YkgJ family cysteine cluster protein [Campylobacter fetus subsp. venerealis]|nr:YkgJ family cysteine cluster protein [Campylobacter fetus subsp. venerealis]
MLKEFGFDYCFDSSKCEVCGAKCCTGDSGYIWISEAEMESLSSHLKLSLPEFKKLFTYRVGVRFSLKEKEYNGAYACLFFDENNNNCSVYEFRPKQCRTFPFWDYFKKHFNELEKECIGVERL